jgi:hypothetical protein
VFPARAGPQLSKTPSIWFSPRCGAEAKDCFVTGGELTTLIVGDYF